MIRLIVFVAGVVVGAAGTLVVQRPKKVAHQLGAAAAFVAKKVREFYHGGESKEDRPDEGPAEVAT